MPDTFESSSQLVSAFTSPHEPSCVVRWMRRVVVAPIRTPRLCANLNLYLGGEHALRITKENDECSRDGERTL